MSVEVLKKALELASADIAEDAPGPSGSNTNRKRKTKKSDGKTIVPAVTAKKPRVKSIIEETLQKPKPDYLRQNLKYLKHSQEKKVDSAKLSKIIQSYDTDKRKQQHWRKHDWDFQMKKKRIKKPCVFSEDDFKKWAATLKPNLRKKILA